jgi:hypothetical protein
MAPPSSKPLAAAGAAFLLVMTVALASFDRAPRGPLRIDADAWRDALALALLGGIFMGGVSHIERRLSRSSSGGSLRRFHARYRTVSSFLFGFAPTFITSISLLRPPEDPVLAHLLRSAITAIFVGTLTAVSVWRSTPLGPSDSGDASQPGDA